MTSRKKVLSLEEFIGQKYNKKSHLNEEVDPKAKIGKNAIVPDGAVLFAGDKYDSKDKNLADNLSFFFTEDIPDFAKKFGMKQKDQNNFINLILTANQKGKINLLGDFDVFLDVKNVGEERDDEGDLLDFVKERGSNVDFRARDARFEGAGVKNNNFVDSVLVPLVSERFDDLDIPAKDITVKEFTSPGILGKKIIKGNKDFQTAAEVIDLAVSFALEL